MIKKVCFFGSYRELSGETKEEIVNLGKTCAEMGITVMSGGFGGTMKDVSQGAKSAGGKTIGVTCYLCDIPWTKKANEFIDEEIVAGSLSERIDIMLKQADAFVILPGGTGTLLELATALEYINKEVIEPKPIIIWGNFWSPVISCLKEEPVFSDKIKNDCKIAYCEELVTLASTTKEAIEKLSCQNAAEKTHC
jgi:uncharacterized protein (TIGR00730 family)